MCFEQFSGHCIEFHVYASTVVPRQFSYGLGTRLTRAKLVEYHAFFQNGVSPIIEASESGSMDVIPLLQKAGASVNSKDNVSNTLKNIWLLEQAMYVTDWPYSISCRL